MAEVVVGALALRRLHCALERVGGKRAAARPLGENRSGEPR